LGVTTAYAFECSMDGDTEPLGTLRAVFALRCRDSVTHSRTRQPVASGMQR
jgi:hypothetical protein